MYMRIARIAFPHLKSHILPCRALAVIGSGSEPTTRPWISNSDQHAFTAAGFLASFTCLTASVALAEEKQGTSGSSGNGRPTATSPQQTQPNEPLTNHPLEFDPVTNEHTALMTMARSAALEYYQAGKYQKAEAKFLEAVAEAQAGFDAKDPHIASCKNNLAEFYRNTKQYAKAEPLYIEALQHLELIYGEKHWLYVGAMHNLALMYEADGRYKQAHDTMSKVLALRLQMFGDHSFLYADSMFALANITRKLGGKDAAQRAVHLMRQAIAILEDAENVQVSVILFWFQDLAEELARQGKPGEAAACLAKALYYMAGDKGEPMAYVGAGMECTWLGRASSLSDSLVDLLLGSRQLEAAAEAMERCLGARVQLFQKDLVVVQSMTKMASIEGLIGKDTALQHASNAVALAQELLQEYSRGPGLGSWFKADTKATARLGLKRVQAGHLLGAALKQLAVLQLQFPAGHKAEGAEAALGQALEALQAASEQAHQQLSRLSTDTNSKAGSEAAGTIEELSSLYVEIMLQRVECYEQLAQLLSQRGDKEGAKKLLEQCDEAASQLENVDDVIAQVDTPVPAE